MVEISIETPSVGEIDADFPPHRMSIDRYKQMVEAGVYNSKDHVFLWKGDLVERISEGPEHAFTSTILHRDLIRLMPESWHVVFQVPIRINPDSMPEPDIMIVRGVPRDYLHRSRTSADVAIVIEVSDATLPQDSVSKFQAYAADGVPIYWVVDLPKGRIHVHGNPTGPAEKPTYREHREYGPGEEIPIVLDGREIGRIDVKEILP